MGGEVVMKSFVVHQHYAEKAGLHQDLRLEEGGVYESWAIPKGVPLGSGSRRLAIKVADHPLSYGSFEGVIEEGYGKGEVSIWDEGTYRALRRESNFLRFRLEGAKLKGIWCLRHWAGNKWLIWKD